VQPDTAAAASSHSAMPASLIEGQTLPPQHHDMTTYRPITSRQRIYAAPPRQFEMTASPETVSGSEGADTPVIFYGTASHRRHYAHGYAWRFFLRLPRSPAQNSQACAAGRCREGAPYLRIPAPRSHASYRRPCHTHGV